MRWICFLILVASTLLALPARFPPKTDFARLLYDIQQGNTSVVNIENLTPGQATGGRARVLWRTGPFSWHEADVPYRVGMPYRWTQTPMTGGIGLLTAIGWTIGLTAAASAFGWAASRL